MINKQTLSTNQGIRNGEPDSDGPIQFCIQNLQLDHVNVRVPIKEFQNQNHQQAVSQWATKKILQLLKLTKMAFSPKVSDKLQYATKGPQL